MAMLKVENVDAGYGPAQVLYDISLEVAEGEIVGIIGPNGHGKSTLFGVINGLVKASRGKVTFKERDITRRPTHERASLGLMQISEGGNLFPNMTVEENLKLGAYNINAWKNKAAGLKEVYALFPSLERFRRRKALHLSGGERKMLMIGRGLMSAAKFLVVDEPSLGLAPSLTIELLKKIKELNSQGITFLVSEQSVEHAAEIASRLYLLEKGRITLQGPTKDVLHNDYVQKAYLGTV